ncbi:hypothetical protein EIL87_07025 [Saccharopolyspora rhizosphaerae]|uniref:Uncharacterized protein n=1 Tax=Saccharopolyspora rhizosphaerae TaxID=2492662 RepID=A0A3R8Q3W5_9PSEU|nr:hypothetical protein [Saccharopolyspora rhizosphaerae]RRO18014.1 hypothetical protein EIL87_07025 [Saccharopolyspora rhizosphaerae]
MTGQDDHGGEVEQLLQAFEGALAETDLLGRHIDPEEEPERLRELRQEVVEHVRAAPVERLPREQCGNCGGQGDVSAVHVRRESESSPPEFTTAQRLCPNCWGTGLSLRHTEP